MLLKHMQVANTPVAVYVDERGFFSVNLPDETGHFNEGENRIGRAATLEDAVARASAIMARKKVKVEVPFRMLNGRDGVATGIHAKTQKITVRIDGRAEQFDAYVSCLVAETPDDVIKTLREIEATKQELLDAYKLNLRGAVTKAIEAAVEAQQQSSEPSEHSPPGASAG